jgi:hypothetical protein
MYRHHCEVGTRSIPLPLPLPLYRSKACLSFFPLSRYRTHNYRIPRHPLIPSKPSSKVSQTGTVLVRYHCDFCLAPVLRDLVYGHVVMMRLFRLLSVHRGRVRTVMRMTRGVCVFNMTRISNPCLSESDPSFAIFGDKNCSTLYPKQYPLSLGATMQILPLQPSGDTAIPPPAAPLDPLQNL